MHFPPSRTTTRKVVGTLVLGSSLVAAVVAWKYQQKTDAIASTAKARTTTEAPLAQAPKHKEKYKDPLAPPKHQQEAGEHPGYYQQWFDLRKDENGTIPHGQRHLWYAHDRQELSAHRNARSSNPIISTAFMGPTNVGGRTRALLVDRSYSNRIFAGGVSGGLWKSNNKGATWAPVNDAASSLAVSSITQSPFNSNIIYYGTGESRANSAGVPGDGIWKSTNGGNSFSQLSSTVSNSHFNQVWKIEHGKQSSKPNTIYVGTENGGLSWTCVLSYPTSVTDIVTFSDGGVMVACYSNGIYYSPSGNSGTFTKQYSLAFPSSTKIRRIEIENCAGSRNTIYALFERPGGKGSMILAQTMNRGSSWVSRPVPSSLGTTHNGYCMMLGVHPTDHNKIIVGASSGRFKYSVNGGQSWYLGPQTHGDYHIVANTLYSNEFYVGNDGGVFRCNWSSMNTPVDVNLGYHTTQFYAGAYPSGGNRAFGGTQDNGTRSVGSVQSQIGGGDGGPCFINLQSSNGDGYWSSQNGYVYRRSNMTAGGYGPYTEISLDTMKKEGVLFIHPYTVNRANGNQVFYPTKKGLWASTNAGSTFRKITGGASDIGPFYAVDAGLSSNPSVYYGGSFGKLYRINNAATASAGSSHTKLTLPSSISTRAIGGIHALSNSTIYVSFTTMSSFPHVWKVTNANGSNPTWTNISGNLPSTLPVNSIAVNPHDTDELFAATDFGLYVSGDGGNTWLKHTAIPNVVVSQVHVRAYDEKLFVFTHGRGIWSCDLKPAYTVVQVRARRVGSNPSPRLSVRKMNTANYIGFNLVLNAKTISAVSSTSWYTYTVIFAGYVPIERIRIYYENEAPSRDVEIDWIKVNGVTRQSETAYTTGTWTSSTGWNPGFKNSQRLHRNGYFHYVRDPFLITYNPPNITPSPAPADVEPDADGAIVFAPQLFPNPVQDQLYVSNQFGTIEGATLAVYSINGQLLAQHQNAVLGEGTDAAQSLKVDHLPAGVYLLSIQSSDGQQETIKFNKY